MFVGLIKADENRSYFRGPADVNIEAHENNCYFRRPQGPTKISVALSSVGRRTY
jgi:hypothetical protein